MDGAQAMAHTEKKLKDFGPIDFLAFSSHKMCGPTGVGVLWGRRQLLDKMSPFMYGGDMIEEVFVNRTTFNKVPHKFEAGTPDISGVIGLKAAVWYLQSIGLKNIQNHEAALVSYAMKSMKEEFGNKIKIIGNSSRLERIGVVAFTLADCHPHDIAGMLGEENICIRAGHHCAMPLHTRFSLNASCRTCFYIYNDKNDVDKFIEGLKKVQMLLK